MKKILFTFFTSIFALFIMASNVSATEVNLNKMTPTEAPNIFYDKEVESYYDVDSGGYIEVFEVKGGEVVGKVDMEEYVERQASNLKFKKEDNLFVNTIIEKDQIDIASPSVWYRYSESSNRKTTLYGSRASIVQRNPGPGADSLSLGFSYTKGHSFNVTLSSGEKTAIKGGVGYTWNNSASVTSSHTMTIPAGYKGYWRFDPRVRVSNGTVKQYTHGFVTKSKTVRTYYPVKIGKFLDGDLVAVKTKL